VTNAGAEDSKLEDDLDRGVARVTTWWG